MGFNVKVLPCVFLFSWLWYIKIRDKEFFFKNDCEFLKERKDFALGGGSFLFTPKSCFVCHHQDFFVVFGYTLEDWHGTYTSPILKGTWSSKPPWLCSMLIFQGVPFNTAAGCAFLSDFFVCAFLSALSQFHGRMNNKKRHTEETDMESLTQSPTWKRLKRKLRTRKIWVLFFNFSSTIVFFLNFLQIKILGFSFGSTPPGPKLQSSPPGWSGNLD